MTCRCWKWQRVVRAAVAVPVAFVTVVIVVVVFVADWSCPCSYLSQAVVDVAGWCRWGFADSWC